jgi:hypothetical protein
MIDEVYNDISTLESKLFIKVDILPFQANAKELHTKNAMPKGWKVVKNTRDYVPPICAIPIYTIIIFT